MFERYSARLALWWMIRIRLQHSFRSMTYKNRVLRVIALATSPFFPLKILCGHQCSELVETHCSEGSFTHTF
jgi:hypothetical protein